MTTDYSRMKRHFDQLISGEYPRSNGLEPVRTSYEKMFDKNLNLCDIHSSSLYVTTNPIKTMVSIISKPSNNSEDSKQIKEPDLKSGIFGMNEKAVFSVSVFPEYIYYTSLSMAELNQYITKVFYTMYKIVSFDRFFVHQSAARDNPYLETIHAYPLYFTFMHILENIPDGINADAFTRIIDKYYVDAEEIEDLKDRMANSKFTDDTELIFRIMSDSGRIDILG